MPHKTLIHKGRKTLKHHVLNHDKSIKIEGEDIKLTLKPSEWYWRNALRNSGTLEKAIEIGMALLFELEEQKKRLIQMGHTPIATYMVELEAIEKKIYYED
jgi:hypothetical protein